MEQGTRWLNVGLRHGPPASTGEESPDGHEKEDVVNLARRVEAVVAGGHWASDRAKFRHEIAEVFDDSRMALAA